MYEFEDMLCQERPRPHHVQLLTSSEGAMASYEEEKARSLASMTGLPQDKVDKILKIHKNSKKALLQERSTERFFQTPYHPSHSLSVKSCSVCLSTQSVLLLKTCSLLWPCLHGDQEEKVQFCFQLFDTTK